MDTHVHSRSIAPDQILTGAEAVARICAQEGVRVAFAYPGTSELALCDALDRVPEISLVSGRGDTEAAFMAAGACAFSPCAAAGILHGARGLTNALGAIATARRNEVGVLYLVGMPSTGSARFLPPHGEPDLIVHSGRFAKWSCELGAPDVSSADQAATATSLMQSLRSAIRIASTRPYGPVIVGLPQDTLETQWIPEQAIMAHTPLETARTAPSLSQVAILIENSQRPLILLDDYFLKDPAARPALCAFAGLLGAPVLQVRYWRGPMLFERLSRSDVPSFVGWYDPSEARHQDLMEKADLLITLEDRNMYPRVIGALPACRKIVITSDAAKSCKNAYMSSSDMVLEGDVCANLSSLADLLRASLPTRVSDGRGRWHREVLGCTSSLFPMHEPVPAAARNMRRGIAMSFARAFAAVSCPVLVDDSQMFGGVLAEEYDQYPVHLRVFGDHAGFVGSGISFATGLAVGSPRSTVVCTLGDQGFCNGMQGLVAMSEQRVPLTLVVCNNGESVSLRKQTSAISPTALQGGTHPILRNPPHMEYQAIAAALGVESCVIDWVAGMESGTLEEVAADLETQLIDAFTARKPHVIELRLPPFGDAWHGIWRTAGLEQVSLHGS